VFNIAISISRLNGAKWIIPNALFKASNMNSFYRDISSKSPHLFFKNTD
jgi:hypothetical protein